MTIFHCYVCLPEGRPGNYRTSVCQLLDLNPRAHPAWTGFKTITSLSWSCLNSSKSKQLSNSCSNLCILYLSHPPTPQNWLWCHMTLSCEARHRGGLFSPISSGAACCISSCRLVLRITGWWFQSLWKILVIWDDEIPNIWKNNPVMFQSPPTRSNHVRAQASVSTRGKRTKSFPKRLDKSAIKACGYVKYDMQNKPMQGHIPGSPSCKHAQHIKAVGCREISTTAVRVFSGIYPYQTRVHNPQHQAAAPAYSYWVRRTQVPDVESCLNVSRLAK